MDFIHSLIKIWSSPVSRNAAGLYMIQFSNFVIPLLTLPYLSRVLGPEVFGQVVFFQSFALWFSIIIEYGFNLSATRDAARFRHELVALKRLVMQVQGAKVLLFLLSLSVLPMLSLFVPLIRENPIYLLLSILQSLSFGFSPFWYFQGTERLVRLVALEGMTKITAMPFVFAEVHRPEDGWKVLAVQSISGLFSTFLPTYWMHREIGWTHLSFRDSVQLIREGWRMFILKSVQSIYTSANAFILGLFSEPMAVGYYSGGEKLYRAILSLSTPLLQSLYPRFSRFATVSDSQDSRLFGRVLLAIMGIGILITLVVYLSAPLLVSLVLGPDYGPAAQVLRILSLAIVMNMISTTFIMLRLLPKRLEKTASSLIISGSILNFILAALLAPVMGALGMALAVLAAECLILVGSLLHMKRSASVFRS